MPHTDPFFLTDPQGNPVASPATGMATTASIPAGAATIGKVEDAAHASGDVGVPSWGVRSPVTPVAVTSAAGDYSPMLTDAEGKQIIANTAEPGQSWSVNVDFTLASSAALVATGGATLRRYITDLAIENTGAAAIRVILLDVAAKKWTVTVPPSSTIVVALTTPLRPAAINTAWNIQLGAVGTVTVTAGGYTGI